MIVFIAFYLPDFFIYNIMDKYIAQCTGCGMLASFTPIITTSITEQITCIAKARTSDRGL